MLRRTALIFVVAMFFSAQFGCGGGSGGSSADESLPEPGTVEEMLHSEAFTGTLMVHFDEALEVRLSKENTLYSDAGADDDLEAVRSILANHPAASITRTTTALPRKVKAARRHLERLSGRELADFNSVFRLEVSDPDEAAEILRELKLSRGVDRVYPVFADYPASLATTPALTGLQGYLYSQETENGLNALAAWDRGVTGEGVYIVDAEHGVNFDHDDLGLVRDYIWQGGNLVEQSDCAPGFPPALSNCDSWIAHGTSVAGVMVAQDNGHGVTGVAPDAYFVQSNVSEGYSGDLRIFTDGIDSASTHADDDIEPGSIWVIEVQTPGKYTENGCGGGDDYVDSQYGCMPLEIYPIMFEAIEQATAYGVLVVSGAGNGQMNLDDDDLYTGWGWEEFYHLGENDSGSILAGASVGQYRNKIDFSNCGSNVNAFAWGTGVVTTGYQYGLYGWHGTEAPVPPNEDNNSFFIDNFGGTSSAAAMLGGAAALVQSHARAELGHRRYLMPAKLRQLLIDSGVPQTSGDCNIGKQPRVDVALDAVDAFLVQARSQYPELDSGELLTVDRMIALRQMGVGIICKAFDVAASDPSCPDSEIYPSGDHAAVDLDFDGDERADLVQWTNGRWRIDLSGTGNGGDNFGTWDLVLDFAPIGGKWVWPYVADMNSDGRTDFVAYDKENGKWYITFTDSDILRHGEWPGWDWEIDYSAEWVDDRKLDPLSCTTGTGPNCSNYSRPAVGDYDGDGWQDIAISCSDGYWRIDYGGPDRDDFGQFNEEVQYLSDEQLAEAPGWAYPTAAYPLDEDYPMQPFYKIPDGLPEAGRLVGFDPYDPTYDIVADVGTANNFGGNDSIFIPAFFDLNASFQVVALSIKEPTGSWKISIPDSDGSFEWQVFEEIEPLSIYGGPDCRPIAADFDGDGISDRAVMCPDEWRIAYSDPAAYVDQRIEDTSRRVPLGYDLGTFTVPGRAYTGGISYAYVQELIAFYQENHPGKPPPIPVDMAIPGGE